MFRLEYDDDLAAQLGVSVQAVAQARTRAYAKIREKLRVLGHDNIPETDEGLYVLLRQVMPGTDVLPGPEAFKANPGS